MNKELNILVDRLNRIFPHLKLYYEGETFAEPTFQKSGKRSDIELMHGDGEYAPPMEYDWFDIIQKLKDNGLEIKNIKS